MGRGPVPVNRTNSVNFREPRETELGNGTLYGFWGALLLRRFSGN
jgi:hypothetical protein